MNDTSRKLQAIAIISAIAVSVAAGAFFALGNPLAQRAYSQESAALSPNSSIKVTGDATASLVPDQATIIVNVQTQPDDLTAVLADQDEKIADIRQAVQGPVGNNATVTVGQRSVSPYYSGYGTPVSDEVTFNIYSSATIQTNINQLSDLVSALAEAGFGFESVYIDSYYSGAFLREAGISPGGSEDEEQAQTENPLTIGVTLNTEPAVLTEAIAEYEQKYRDLLAVLAELDISEDQIKQNNFSINPVYFGSNPTASYNAYTQVIVKTSPENIDDVTRAVRGVDSTFVENVFISVSDDAIDNARKDLTDQAIANARERASEMVEDLGFEVAGIKSIEAATGSSVSPYGGEVLYRGVKVVQPYYYQSISGDISVSVTVEFELAESEE
jgi:uncharacterized protein YggE